MTATKSANVIVRVPWELKHEAEKVLAKLGLTPADAVADFYRHIVEEYEAGGKDWLEIPHVSCCPAFGKPPNVESLAAMKEIDEGGGARYGSVAELRAAIENELADDGDGNG